MDFSFNEDQLAIREAVERVFTEMCNDDALKELARSSADCHQPLWSQLAETGMLALAIPKGLGGMGMGLVELCLVLEQQGRATAPAPLLSNLVECAITLAESENAALCESILPDVAHGRSVLAPVRPYRGLQERSPLRIDPAGGGWVLNGSSGFSPYCAQADGLLVSLHDEEGSAFLLYQERQAPGVSVIEQRAINDEPAGYVEFEDVHVSRECLVAHGESAEGLMLMQRHRAWIGLAAMQTGVLDEGLSRTASYVSERKQFGRALGSFQAVSQRAADAYMEIECLRSAYWRALDDIEHAADVGLSAAVAKYWAGVAGHHAGHTFLHLHGGIGQDLEFPIHRYFLWAKQCERYHETPDKLEQWVGDLLVAGLET